jgi:hypothetical protein
MPFRLLRNRNSLLVAVAFWGTAQSASNGFVALHTEGSLTYYQGTATLQGKVERRTDETWLELMGDLVCFEASGASKALIPRTPDDSRAAWFCFDDDKETMKLLRLPRSAAKGTCGYEVQATVRVTGYVVNREESEVTDVAKLVSVVARGPLRNIKCP